MKLDLNMLSSAALGTDRITETEKGFLFASK